MNNNFGKFLSEKRKEVGLTQKQLGAKLYVTESTISKWEKNKANPDISMISELATILNVSEHELITASIDNTERKRNQDAKKWKILVTVWDKFFIISYLITLATCFICNLAVSGTLDWFWIVLCSLILSASFTTFPRFFTKHKLLLTTITQLLSLILLLLVCCLYTNGKWFLLAIIPIIVGFIIIFLPIYVSKYNFPQLIKKHTSLICIFVDIACVIFLLFVLCKETGGNWFVNFALPMTLFCSIVPLSFVVVCEYMKTSKLLKASILTFLFLPFSIIAYLLTQTLCLNAFVIKIESISTPNFANWSNNSVVSSNVCAIILLALFATSMILMIFHICNATKNSAKK